LKRKHRWNILNPDYTCVGVARGYHITEDFAPLRLNPIFEKSDLAL